MIKRRQTLSLIRVGTTVFKTQGLAKCQMCGVYYTNEAQKFQKGLTLCAVVVAGGLACVAKGT